jgi:hypothetical protein
LAPRRPASRCYARRENERHLKTTGSLAKADLDFDLGVIGFDASEIDLIIEEGAASDVAPPEGEGSFPGG